MRFLIVMRSRGWVGRDGEGGVEWKGDGERWQRVG